MANKVLLNMCLYRWTRVPFIACESFGGYTYRHMCKEFEASRTSYPVVTPVIFFSHNTSPKSPNEKNKRPKTGTYTKINLLETDGKLTITSFEEAEKLAKRRDLKLVKIVDSNATCQRSVYKMMTAAQYFEEELKSRKLKAEKKKNEMKGEKLLSLSDKIENHDLQSKLKIMKKWLEKRHEVRVVITESEEALSAQVCNTIESSTKELGRIVQKRQKGKEIKFSILPAVKKEKEVEEPNVNE